MNKNVSANRLAQIASEIEYKTGIAEDDIRKLQRDINDIIQKSNKLQSFNGTGVSGSTNYTVGEKDANGNIPVTHTWSVWSIKGPSEKKSAAGELNRKLANVLVVLQNLTRLARRMQGSADNISSYESLIEGLDWEDSKEYTVQRGDTLSAIASANGITVAELAKYNNIEDPDYIETGQKIVIPPKVTIGNSDSNSNEYVVQRGDTLSAIARANGITVAELAKYNNIEDPDYIETGQKIIIPKEEKKKKDTLKMDKEDSSVQEVGETYPIDDKKGTALSGGSQQEDWVEIGKKAYNGDVEAEKKIIDFLAPIAQELHRRNGVKASVLISQVIGESGWLTRVAGKNNVAAMNEDLVNNQWESEWNGESTMVSVPQEISPGNWVYGEESMRVYPDIETAMTDNSDFLTQYKFAGKSFADMTEAEKTKFIENLSNMSVEEYVDNIKSYATDSSYKEKVLNRIDKFNLTQYDE